MKIRRFVDLRMVLLVVLLPVVLAGLYVLLVQIHGLVRYDSTYFTQAYREEYDTPGSAARALEGVLQTGDQELLAELQGMRRPAPFETGPKITFTMLWERTDRYISYLYFDMDTYRRHTHYIEEVDGRWVVSPTDAYYHLYSGRWLKVAVPLAMFWWLLGTITILIVLVSRISARLREQMYGAPGSE